METKSRSDQTAGWKSGLAIWSAGLLIFETLTGLSIWLLPFTISNQIFVLLHTFAGLLLMVPCGWYLWRHWRHYRKAVLTHIKLFGYVAVGVLAVCALSGLVLTGQALLGTRIQPFWDIVHILTTVALVVFLLPHVGIILWRAYSARRLPEIAPLLAAARHYILYSIVASLAFFAVSALAIYSYRPPQMVNEFSPDYSYAYGEDRPFAPSQATSASGNAIDSRLLAGSESCGTAGCHDQIYAEWEASAHRYAAMDIAFQKIQLTMAEQNGPESTRYCGGCHDPISLFSGTKNIFTDVSELTSLSGYQEGVSCMSCHGIRETDLKGNAHYTMSPPDRYLFEIEYAQDGGELQRGLRDFLIRAYPRHHTDSLSKRLFKAPEYCAACHKQFIDEEINNVGWVQLQNQYDNWRKSHWNQPDQAEKTIECRECHMPLTDSSDPAAGDSLDSNRSPGDGKHRNHRFIAANQLMPRLLKLPGWEIQTELTEKWLRGEVEIPEIADKWAEGPAVTLELEGPESVQPGQPISLKTVITSNKVGHDFPTGPLDIIQAWVEMIVTDDAGRVVYSTGTVDEAGFIAPGSFIFKAEPVDQYGNLIDRHNLWEMVGVRHRRALFPGFSDTASFTFTCPDLHVAAGSRDMRFEPEKVHTMEAPATEGMTLHVQARLNYRKIDQYLLKFVFGEGIDLTSTVTEMARVEKTIRVGD